MTKVTLDIWARQFSLPIEFDLYPGDQVYPEQEKALSDFIENAQTVLSHPDAIATFIIENAVEDVHDRISNIFRFVVPKCIFVPHNKKKQVAILCDYKFDPEHGLAVVYENCKLKEIGPEDIIL